MQFHHYAELTAFVAGIGLLRKDWPSPYKWLVALAGLTFIVELIGFVMWTEYRLNNNWIYNLFLPLQCLTILCFFYSVLVNHNAKAILKWLIIIMLPGTFISYYFHGSFIYLNSYASTLYLGLMLVAAGLFYIDAIINTIEVKLVRQPAFWIATGLFFFCVIYILLFALWNQIVHVPYYKLIFKYSNIIANALLYGGIVTCFICLLKTKNSYSPSL